MGVKFDIILKYLVLIWLGHLHLCISISISISKWTQMCLGQPHFVFHLWAIYECIHFDIHLRSIHECRVAHGHPFFSSTLSCCSLIPNLCNPQKLPLKTLAPPVAPLLFDYLSTSCPFIAPVIHLLS